MCFSSSNNRNQWNEGKTQQATATKNMPAGWDGTPTGVTGVSSFMDMFGLSAPTIGTQQAGGPQPAAAPNAPKIVRS